MVAAVLYTVAEVEVMVMAAAAETQQSTAACKMRLRGHY